MNKYIAPILIGLVVVLVILSGSMFTVDQRQNDFCHFDLAAPSSKRRRAFHGCKAFVRCVLGRNDRPGRNGIHEDLVLGKFERHRLGQCGDSGLRDVIRQIPLVSRSAASGQPVTEVDDAPTSESAHVRCRRARAQPSGAKIHVELGLPDLDSDVVERDRSVYRGHVDEHVEPAKAIDGAFDDLLASSGLTQVCLKNDRALADGFDCARRLLCFRLRTVVDQRDVRTPARQLRCDDGADSTPTGDQGYATVEIHG